MPTPDLITLRHHLALTGGRRPLLGGLAALSLGGALLADEDADAKRKRAQAEKKRKPRNTLFA